MRVLIRVGISVLVIVSMLQTPGFAANEKPLGIVVQATYAQVDQSKLAIGTTVYPGDNVATEDGGTLRLKFGASQVYLLGASSATLGQTAGTVHASVGRGTVGFASNGTDKVELELPQGILRAEDGKAGYGQATIVNANQVIISAYRGSLVLDNDGELHTIPEGKSFRVTMDLEPAAAEPAASPSPASPKDAYVVHPRRRRRLIFAIILVGGTAAIGYALWNELSESPSKFSY